MSPFIALEWSVGDGEAVAAVDRFDNSLESGGWLALHRRLGFSIYATRRRPIRLRTLTPSGGVVLGDLFARGGADAPQDLLISEHSSWLAAATTLVDRYWGRYGAILCDGRGDIRGLLRDPSGAVEVITWRRHGVRVVTSTIEDGLLAPLRADPQIDWTVVGSHLKDFSTITARSALRSVEALAPGAALALEPGAPPRSVQIWRPDRFARQIEPEKERATQWLRKEVETCVAAHARGAGRILTEVSGGLDSSIVAACLPRQERFRLSWMHHTSDERGGDETAYVDILSGALAFTVAKQPKRPFKIDPEEIARTQTGVRPSFSALDPPYDAQMVEAGSSCGIDSIFTGMAGDGLFFLSAWPAIAVDLVRRRRVAALLSEDFYALARWTRRSAWRLSREAILGALFKRPPRGGAPPSWVSSEGGANSPHPWLADAYDLPPAKHRHIEELVHALLFYGTSSRAAAFDLVHPLLSQPLMELCLRIPVDLLTHGGRDRALARAAFRGSLPAALIDRRSKGELSPYYSRAFAEGLPALRSYLLDGRLVQHGLLLKRELELALEDAHLAQFGDSGSLLRAAAMEGWVRRWGG